MNSKAILFDFDNTLVTLRDAERYAEATLGLLIKKHYHILPAQFLPLFKLIKRARIHSHGKPEEMSRLLWITEALARLGVKEDYDVSCECVDAYWKEIKKHIALFPGAMLVLKELRKTYKIGIISDSYGNRPLKMDIVEHLGLLPLIHALVTSDDVGNNKPHPDNFLLMCDKLSVKPKDCVMVGDTPLRDLSVAKELGMTTVWNIQATRITKKYPYIDYEIITMTDLLALLRKC